MKNKVDIFFDLVYILYAISLFGLRKKELL